MYIYSRRHYNQFVKQLPLELWFMIMELCEDEYWSDANLCVAMGLNFHYLKRLMWIPNNKLDKN